MDTGFKNNKDTDRSNDIRKVDVHLFHTDGNGLLLSYEGPGGEIEVPEGVGTIGEEVFAFCTQVTGVILPEGVCRIARRAFYRSGIKTITLPATLKRIEKHAFSGSLLESIEIPDQVTVVEERAFYGAEHLKKAKLPERMISLEPGVFSGCSSLQEVILPKSLKHIEGSAFMMCSSLEHISLPERLVSIWKQAFSGCSSLREIWLGDCMEAIGHADFKDCTSLEKVRIPENLKMINCYAFQNTGRIIMTGPGQDSGMIVDDDDIRYFPGSKKLFIPEGVKNYPYYALKALPEIEILDIPRSLENYSLSVLSQLRSLRQIVTDRDSPAGVIALMLDLELVDRSGCKFKYSTPDYSGEWLFKECDGESGVCLTGCRGRIGHTSMEDYTTVVIPDEIGGRPVTSIGNEAFYKYDQAEAFYIPDSVRYIGSAAFARNEFCKHGRKLFIRKPKYVNMAKNAFFGTVYYTKDSAREAAQQKKSLETKSEGKADFNLKNAYNCAVHAADDPMIGTGTVGRPALKPNIWQYLDRLSRDELIQELTHSFLVNGHTRGAGWASIDIEIDGEKTWFQISYTGNSPVDFIDFAEQIEDGENEIFGWESEPGWFPWIIQRRGSIFYVNVPVIEKSFFIPREAFLRALDNLTGDW